MRIYNSTVLERDSEIQNVLLVIVLIVSVCLAHDFCSKKVLEIRPNVKGHCLFGRQHQNGFNEIQYSWCRILSCVSEFKVSTLKENTC